MIETMKKLLISALLLIPTYFIFAQADDIEDFDFIVLNEEAEQKPEVYVKEYRGTNTAVRIPSQFEGNDIIGIWDNAFAGKGLTSVVLPNSIYDISREAFANNALAELAIPDNVSYIGWKAFAENQLTSVTIPGRILISGLVFYKNKITRIKIGSNVFFGDEERPSFELGFDDFYKANKRRAGTYIYSDDQWSVEYNVVDNEDFEFEISHRGDGPMEALITGYRGTNTEIEIPGNFPNYYVVNIGEKALAGKGLTSVVLPHNLNYIEPEAFADNALTDITIPESVYWINDRAFAGNSIASITIPDDVSISSLAFAGNYITRITIGLGVYLENEEGPVFELGFDTFYASNKERAGTYIYTDDRWSVKYDIIENGFAANIAEDGESVQILDYFGSDTVVSIPSQMGNFPVSTIGYWAFYKKGLIGVTIPGSVTAIHEGAFAENNFVTVTIPGNVNNVGREAFMGNNLTAVIIDEGVAAVGERSFAKNKITDLTIPNSVATIDRQAFAGNRLTSVIIPDTVKTIWAEAFADNMLTSVSIPSGITSIVYRAFAGNQLTSISIPDSVTSIGSEAFVNNQLTEITISSNVTSISDRAFRGNRISSVFIPNSVTRMGVNVFDNTVTVVYAPDDEKDFKTELNESGGVTITGYVGKKREIRIPALIDNMTVTEIGADSFWYKKLTSVTIPDTVTAIKHRAFFYNEIKEITLPDSVTYISDRAFYGNGLSKINIPDGNTFIGYRTFTMNNLKNITIPDSVTIIEAQAFDGNRFTEIIIPHSVAIIGYEAFARNPVEKITIGALVSIGEYSFNNKFYDSYVNNGRKAGVYQYIDGQWNYSGTDEENEIALALAEKRNLHLIATAADPWNFLGYHYYSRGRYEEAITAFTEAILIAPHSSYLRLMRGLSYDKLNELDNAIADFTEAIRLNPSSAGAYNNRAAVYDRKGNKEQALSDLEQALLIDPEHETLKRNREKILNEINN